MKKTNSVPGWKDINGWVGLYQISNEGVVRGVDRCVTRGNGRKQNWRGVTLAKTISKNGYYRVGLHKDGVKTIHNIHVLVALTFIANPLKKRTVNHKDGNKLNNTYLNLEWATHSENNKHAYALGLRDSTKKRVG